jgi:hypothetical protein
MSVMNDAAINLAAPPIENDVTAALTQALQDARAGRIVGVVIVKTHGPELWSYSSAGNNPTSLTTGSLAAAIGLVQKMTTPQSPIVRAIGDVPRA